MGASAPKSQTVTQKTELPAWLEGVTKENLAIADTISKRPYQAYGGQLSAGFTPDQTAAFDAARASVGASAPAFNAAQAAAAGSAFYRPERVRAGNFLSGDVSAYMNPFIENVETAALAREQDALRQGLNTIGDRAIAARAFGGSRQGVAEGVAAAESAKNIGELSAGLRSRGFDAASGLMQNDMTRALQAGMANQSAGLQGAQARAQAALGLGSLAESGQSAALRDAATLEGIGQTQQAREQQLLDEQYARFLEERNYPIEMLNLRLGATTATPYGSTSTQTRSGGGGGGSSFLTGLGTATTAATTAMKLLPMLFGSDERMKTDIEKVGKDKETGLDIYAYRYKGDPKSYPKVVGPMAQDIEKKYPEEVKTVGGRKAVNLGFGPMKRAMT